MSYLIINRDKGIKLSEILEGVKDDLIVLSWYPLEDSSEFKYYEVIPNLRDLTHYLEFKVIELSKEYNIETIIAEDEFDLIRAGRLRDYLKIEGQSELSAKAFRDKVLMKDYLKEIVNVPKYSSIENALDIYNFVEKTGYPFVIKPRDKAGAQGVKVVRNKDELYEILKSKIDSNSQIERFISGSMYHVDAVVENNNITMFMVSKYVNGCLSFMKSQEILSSYQIDVEDPLYDRLSNYFNSVIDAMPIPPISAYHMEVFHTDSDELIFCEIGSRIGGGKIMNAFENTYSVDLLSYLYRRWAKLPVDSPKYQEKKLTAFMMVPPKKGKLLKLPEEINYDWVQNYNKLGEIGKDYNNPNFFSESIASIVITGTSSNELIQRISLLQDWLSNEIQWDVDLIKV
ncbi:ATP-grasp domain-containing protein [Priestia megaterium]|uniref:ATP-grasp domain-containing protein n=1 Tax=Priestia megaterium TaxID=1404 RepID=UPI00189DD622|nr:ATP-grasp domain-containing protein [Priestia megaterium]